MNNRTAKEKHDLKEYYEEAEALGKTVREVADELLVADATVRIYCKLHGIQLRKAGNVGRGKKR